MEHRIGIVVQARYDSSRLPGKAELKLWRSESTISFLLKRLLRLTHKQGQWLVLATATSQDCDFFERICKNLGIFCFRGDKENVFSRYHQCSNYFSFDAIVRITGDCVLHCPNLIQSFIDSWLAIDRYSSSDFIVTNKYPFSYCDGFDIEIFSKKLINKHSKIIEKFPQLQEHVTTYFYEEPEIKKINILSQNPLDFTSVRLVLDYQEDLIALRQIISSYAESFSQSSPIENMTYQDITSLELFKSWAKTPLKSPNAAYLVQDSTLYV